jgi:hypothetical protein
MIVHEAKGDNDDVLEVGLADADPVHPSLELTDISKKDTVVETLGGTVEIVWSGSFHVFFGKLSKPLLKTKDFRPTRHIL